MWSRPILENMLKEQTILRTDESYSLDNIFDQVVKAHRTLHRKFKPREFEEDQPFNMEVELGFLSQVYHRLQNFKQMYGEDQPIPLDHLRDILFGSTLTAFKADSDFRISTNEFISAFGYSPLDENNKQIFLEIEEEHLASIDFNSNVNLNDIEQIFNKYAEPNLLIQNMKLAANYQKANYLTSVAERSFVNVNRNDYINFEKQSFIESTEHLIEHMKNESAKIKKNPHAYSKEFLKKLDLQEFTLNNPPEKVVLPKAVGEIVKIFQSNKLPEEVKIKKMAEIAQKYQAKMPHTMLSSHENMRIFKQCETLYKNCQAFENVLNIYYKINLTNIENLLLNFTKVINHNIKNLSKNEVAALTKSLDLTTFLHKENGKEIAEHLPKGIKKILGVLHAKNLTYEEKFNEIIEISKKNLAKLEGHFGKNKNIGPDLVPIAEDIAFYSNQIYMLAIYLGIPTVLPGNKRPLLSIPISGFNSTPLTPEMRTKEIYEEFTPPLPKSRKQEEMEEKSTSLSDNKGSPSLVIQDESKESSRSKLKSHAAQANFFYSSHERSSATTTTTTTSKDEQDEMKNKNLNKK